MYSDTLQNSKITFEESLKLIGQINNLKFNHQIILPYVDFRLCNLTIRNSKGDYAKQIPRSLLVLFPPDVEATARVSVTGRLTKLSSCTELVCGYLGAQRGATV